MLTLRLPDGSARQYPDGTRARDVAESIGKRLAQAAVAAKVDDTVLDLDREIPAGEHAIAILTDKDREALDVLRHSCAHIMARAVMRLFPGTQLAFGPTIEHGFYYDIDSPTPIREEDFPRIEAEMAKIVKEAEPFERFEKSHGEARGLMEDLKQTLKVEHVDELKKEHEEMSFYRQGEFLDLCRGPHIPHAGKVGAFKLLSIAGAYWKNNANRKQLQRLYGTAFFSQKDLDAYLKQIEEAKKRDHRTLGKQLRLFTISQLAGSGLILWMPKGATVRGLLEAFIKDELVKRGYEPVYTPHIGRLELYRTSGHFPYYRDSQYPPMFAHPAGSALDLAQHRLAAGPLDEAKELEMVNFMKLTQFHVPGYAEAKTQADKLHAVGVFVKDVLQAMDVKIPDFAVAKEPAEQAEALMGWLKDQEGYLLKPMNCPHHIQIYKAEPRSYRDLPIRLAEFGTVYRYEQSGELGGMTRVRGFTQDDAHLFVTPEQIETEVGANIDLVLFVLSSLGLNDYRVRVGLRDPNSAKYIGDPEDWNRAEQTLLDLVKGRGMNSSRRGGRGGLLRSEDRLRCARLHRPRVATGHRAARLQPAEALRAGVRRRRQQGAPAGDDPSSAVRLDGALHGHPDRALRRSVSAVVGAGTSARPADQREVHRVRQEGGSGIACGRIPNHRRLASGENRRQNPRGATGEDPVHARCRRKGNGVGDGGRARPCGRRHRSATVGGPDRTAQGRSAEEDDPSGQHRDRGAGRQRREVRRVRLGIAVARSAVRSKCPLR